jgi:hypothetical protein
LLGVADQPQFMMLQFTKNVHFTRLVKISDRLREFNFRRVPDATEQLFHVDVSDDRGNRIVFRLRKQDNHWQIIEQELPQWISSTEKVLSDVISEEGY